jgi:hypothetical protein
MALFQILPYPKQGNETISPDLLYIKRAHLFIHSSYFFTFQNLRCFEHFFTLLKMKFLSLIGFALVGLALAETDVESTSEVNL